MIKVGSYSNITNTAHRNKVNNKRFSAARIPIDTVHSHLFAYFCIKKLKCIKLWALNWKVSWKSNSV